MSSINDIKLKSVVFLLTGIPGEEDIYLWISITFCIAYVISILGNSVILFFVKTDPSLHKPMYIFLSMLAVTDLGILVATMLTIVGIYLFKSREISLDACLVHFFFIHLLQCIESSVLLLMAFDRFIAICNHLRYASILTLLTIAKMGLVDLLRAMAIILPIPFLLKQFRYYRDNVLSLSYSLHQEVMKMACSDITVNSIYGLFIKLFQMELDLLCIFLSYVMILKTVLSIASHKECLRALNTFVSHLCTVLLFFTPEISLSVIRRFVKGSSSMLQSLLGYMSLLLPPLMNPIVSSVKSKHLRASIVRVFVK